MLMTLKEASLQMGYAHVNGLRFHILKGHLPHVKKGNAIYVDSEDLTQLKTDKKKSHRYSSGTNDPRDEMEWPFEDIPPLSEEDRAELAGYSQERVSQCSSAIAACNRVFVPAPDFTGDESKRIEAIR